MRRTLASPIFAISSKRPSAIFAEVLSASMRTARRGERASEGMTATRIQSNGGFHMRVAPLNDLIFNRITIQSDRSMAAGGLLRPGTVCRSSCYTSCHDSDRSGHRQSGSQRTRRWRERASNPRSRRDVFRSAAVGGARNEARAPIFFRVPRAAQLTRKLPPLSRPGVSVE